MKEENSALKKLTPFAGLPVIAGAYLVVMITTHDWFTITRALMLIVFGYIASYSDLRTRLVPNKLVLAMLVAWLSVTALYILIDIQSAMGFLLPSLIGGLSGGGFFLIMYLVSGKGIGGGDIKLITVIGLFLTFAKLLPMLFISSLLIALFAGALLLMKKATMKSAIPMVPFLYAGVLVVLFV